MSDPNRKENSYSEKPNNSDSIYRQDTLEALRTCYETERIDYTNGNEYINYEQAVHEVEQLPSAQSEKRTEERTETHACDLISRQAAIDEIGEWIKAFLENGHKESAADARLIQDGIIQLPSAQPVDKDINVPTNDYISRQAAIDAAEKESQADGAYGYMNTKSIVDLLNNLPSAQQKRPKGHWVEIGDEPFDEWECDMCGFVIDGSGCIDPEEYRDVYKFCPNCGADMRGEQE